MGGITTQSILLNQYNETIPIIIAVINKVVMNAANVASVPVRFAAVITPDETGTATPIPTITATMTPIMPLTKLINIHHIKN